MRRAVGLLHPGAMGQRIGLALVQAGNEVWWCGEGRSPATASRAEKNGFRDAGSLPNLVEKCKVIVCLCPPVAALPIAHSVLSSGFQGMYCDANALIPDDAMKVIVGISPMLLLDLRYVIQSIMPTPFPSLKFLFVHPLTVGQIADVVTQHGASYVDASIISFCGLRLCATLDIFTVAALLCV